MDMPLDKKSSFTDFFIHHPIFSWVINLIVILLGVTSFVKLPLRQYPVIDKPTITLRISDRTQSNPSLLENMVTRPLEDALAGLSGLSSLKSETSKGDVRIWMEFRNRNIDSAAADVLDIKSNMRFPQDIKNNLDFNLYRGNSDSSSNLLTIMLTAKDPKNSISLSELQNLGKETLKNQIESIPGVSQVEVEGGGELQMMVRLDPLRMKTFKVDPEQVRQSLERHNFQLPTGNIKEKEKNFDLVASGCPKTCEQFAQLIVSSYEKDKFVRVGDVAELSITPKEITKVVFFNGRPAVSLDVSIQNNANPIEISKEVHARLDQIKKTLPKGIGADIAFDDSGFIKESIFQVYKAIFEAFVLVLLVILVFLRSLRASLIPLVTIPISLMGTFFFMEILGFSLNIFSLLALVLAIGLVVDDAIVVLENIYRYIERGIKPFKAAILGTREIRFSIIAMTLTLVAVYAPIAIAPGNLGKIFREFALTLAIAVLLSGLTALTLSSVMCARLLKSDPHGSLHGGSPKGFLGRLSSGIETSLNGLEHAYGRGAKFVLSHRAAVLGLAVGFCFLSIFWAKNFLRTEIAPASDEGMISVQCLPIIGKNMTYIKESMNRLDKNFLAKDPMFKDRYIQASMGEGNRAFLMLAPWGERKIQCQDLIAGLQSKLDHNVLGLRSFHVNCQTNSILGSSDDNGNAMTFRLSTHDSMENLIEVMSGLLSEIKKLPSFERDSAWVPVKQVQYAYSINQERTAPYNIHPKDVASTIEMLLTGTSLAGDFERDGVRYPVIISVEQSFEKSLDQLNDIFMRGYDDKNQTIMVPIKGMLDIKKTFSEVSISHFMKQRTLEMTVYLKPGTDVYKTFLAFQKEQEKSLPSGYSLQPSGTLETIVEEQQTLVFIFIMATLFIFLVMAAQFESFRAPFIIMLTVPLALSSALIFLGFIRDGSLNSYSQIGLITLIGLITKHGILIVDFANQKREEGLGMFEAIVTACQLRLRPVLMTTLAMVFGALPLALASGPGSEARVQIGTIIVGGMTLGTMFTLFVLPVLYTLIMGKTNREKIQTYLE